MAWQQENPEIRFYLVETQLARFPLFNFSLSDIITK